MNNLIKKILFWKMTILARMVIFRRKPEIIAITGSVGKTSTKEAIYTVLSGGKNIKKCEDDLGGNKSILFALLDAKHDLSIKGMIRALMHGMDVFVFGGEYPETIILEFNARKVGDIKKIAKWLHPDIVLVTRLPEVPVHIEFFKGSKEMTEEKMSIARALKMSGTLILNADDDNVMAHKEDLKSKTLTYGGSESANIRFSDVALAQATSETKGGLTFKANFDEKIFPVFLPDIYSESYVYIALSALAVAYAKGMNMVHAIERLLEYKTPQGRMQIIYAKNDVVFIDDSFNSSPLALESALSVLGNIPFGKRKVAVLGDMLELGRFTDESHFNAGQYSYKHADILVTSGLRAKKIAEGAKSTRMSHKKIFETENERDTEDILFKILKKGDVVLVKGAKKMNMRKIIDSLLGTIDA